MNADGAGLTPFDAFLFDPLRPWLAQLPAWPDRDALCALAEREPRHNARGLPIRFIDPPGDGLGYEARIDRHGEVETRPDNWHDFFNALVWLTFPQAKSALSAAHAAALAQATGPIRCRQRDALTQFDECGIVVVSTSPALLDLLRGFAWRSLFVEQRAAVRQSMRFIVFGHATYEQLLAPYRGLTAKAILYEVAPGWLAAPPAAQLADLDQRLANDFASARHATPRHFQPLPLLGIPGLTPDSEDPAYYDDTWQFRPGRQPHP